MKELSWRKAEESISEIPEVLEVPRNSHQHDEIQSSSPRLSQEQGTLSQDWAATIIQAAFRGYLVSFFMDSLFLMKMRRMKA